jgi:hypothetical protein
MHYTGIFCKFVNKDLAAESYIFVNKDLAVESYIFVVILHLEVGTGRIYDYINVCRILNVVYRSFKLTFSVPITKG